MSKNELGVRVHVKLAVCAIDDNRVVASETVSPKAFVELHADDFLKEKSYHSTLFTHVIVQSADNNYKVVATVELRTKEGVLVSNGKYTYHTQKTDVTNHTGSQQVASTQLGVKPLVNTMFGVHEIGVNNGTNSLFIHTFTLTCALLNSHIASIRRFRANQGQ